MFCLGFYVSAVQLQGDDAGRCVDRGCSQTTAASRKQVSLQGLPAALRLHNNPGFASVSRKANCQLNAAVQFEGYHN
jgi:ubiquitin C-terminal hydrolase